MRIVTQHVLALTKLWHIPCCNIFAIFSCLTLHLIAYKSRVLNLDGHSSTCLHFAKIKMADSNSCDDKLDVLYKK